MGKKIKKPQDYLDGLSDFKTDSDYLIYNKKVQITCDICRKFGYGAHLWLKENQNDRLEGYDWIKLPDGWYSFWSVNGMIYACSKSCAIRLNTDLFYD